MHDIATKLERPGRSEEREGGGEGAGGLPAAPAAAATGASEASPLKLDLEPNNSPRGFLMPNHRGGKLDPDGGKASRFIDLDRFEALGLFIRHGVFITLTVNRENFYGPEQAYKAAMKLVSKLLHLLGITVWGRVLEFQQETGDGWPHWHIIADVSGTRWCRGSWIELGPLADEIWRLWRDVWGIGGCKLERMKSRKRVAGYMVKYLTKGVEVPPVWVLTGDRAPRLVGFSKAARAKVRRALGEPEPSRVERAGPVRRRQRRHALLERLAWSGMTSTVIFRDADGRGHYCGTVAARPCDIMQHREALPWVKLVMREVRPGRTRLCIDVEGSSAVEVRQRVKLMNATLACLGVPDEVRAIAARRRAALLIGWERMQAEQEGWPNG